MSVLPDWMIEAGVKIDPFSPCRQRPGKISYGTTSYGYDFRVSGLWKLFNPNKLLNSTGSNVIDPKTFNDDCLDVIDLCPNKSVTHKWVKKGGNRNYPDYWYCSQCQRVEPKDPSIDPYKCDPVQPPNFIIIPAHSFALCESVEYVEIPRDCLCVVVGKSTYARCGIQVMCTPLEPEWRGKITVEIANTTPCPAKVYVDEGIMQGIFFQTAGRMKQVYDLLRSHYPASLDTNKATCRVSYADKKGIYQDQKGLTLPTVGADENKT